MGQSIPKQFINVHDKPIIVYTLEKFQKHPQIDKILVVCLEGWDSVLKAYAEQFDLTKLEWVVPGSDERQKSILNGLNKLKEVAGSEDLIILHDAVRPLVSLDIISDLIVTANTFGNAISSLPVVDQIVVKDSASTTSESIPRDTLKIVTTPQAYKLGAIVNTYEKAYKDGKAMTGNHSINTLMHEYGERLYFSKGSEINFKLTSTFDIYRFKAILETEKADWLK
ncbi:2-C-methyl-D-erythritol 4-phosphate cytidylyltransferase [Alkalibacterium subtropicum]|uniref:2-C-methyl-D-erythritol 4-phosphate cytidylyltransferase n=1 Tax=Alkalibacterium subtropicum TaxID=753702 RepID=A0A1I1GDS4_9LACT|nr:IspD/TarI family cytidylyltransferase [Alkalibacterium subtropicum]SFC09694.1 2-C-methyl-D-erythritol 4-phosphate cytidylyltransferase [Alkalibacterium subtropicum]